MTMCTVIALLACVSATTAFSSSSSVFGVVRSSSAPLSMANDSMDDMRGPNFVQRGVSVDQDGKSNVWAIEPKMEVSTKSSEENMQSAIIAGGGLAVMGLLAGVALLNLPDPNQF